MEIYEYERPSYRPLLKTLAKQNKLKKHLREEAGISGTTLTKISNRQFLSLEVISRICKYLECDIKDVVTFEHEGLAMRRDMIENMTEEEVEALRTALKER